MADGVSRDDLRAAVAAGIIDESQAVSLQTLSDKRMGYRANMVGDDEPFELFRGFAEIFVTVGLALLMSGLLGLSAFLGETAAVPFVALCLSWALALYFTRKRRMTLPSIALCISFAVGVGTLIAIFLFSEVSEPASAGDLMTYGLIGMASIAIYFRVFRLPFAMFVLGIFAIVLMLGIVMSITPSDQVYMPGDLKDFFDLRKEPEFAIGMLVFGCIAFVAALWFDTKDPHRVSRHAATAFWLHILAAPALVNTLVMSNYLAGGVIGTSVAVALLTVFTLLAIVIDRRSFLTAGLIYMGLLMADAIANTSGDWAPILTMLFLGVFVTALGAFWTQARAAIMSALPEFPGKDRLPPYSAGLAVE